MHNYDLVFTCLGTPMCLPAKRSCLRRKLLWC